MKIIKILFVCHGNICRSPMAEFVMKDLISKKGMENLFEIASAATSSEEIGNPIYPPVKRILSSLGIDSTGKKATRIKASDYGYYDYLVGMDDENIHNMKRMFSEDPEKKIHKLLEFADSEADVADPWWTGNFDAASCDIKRGCEAFLDYLCNTLS